MCLFLRSWDIECARWILREAYTEAKFRELQGIIGEQHPRKEKEEAHGQAKPLDKSIDLRKYVSAHQRTKMAY